MQAPQLLTPDGALATLEAMAGSLRIDAHEHRLQTHLRSILDDRQKEIANVRSHADAALAELAGVREREQALLQRRVEALERQFREGIADLEQRFLLQAEHLKRELLAKIVETKATCDATIEAKAVQLAAALENSDRCPCVTAAGARWNGVCQCEDAPEPRTLPKPAQVQEQQPRMRHQKGMLLKQHTVSGTWQDSDPDQSPKSILHQGSFSRQNSPCPCRRAYRVPGTLRTFRAADLIDSDDDDDEVEQHA